ncbi:MAG: MotA/TolQ/ExbB proton channel family protein [Candidatus Accumulibacter phosphatis]|jgi:biopolymer transport protein ExbB|uniref:Biopolymer transport protein ExbB n=1 Tax=Candidatus Accumulibacter contiguus TaxID=2954381 RepID=A0ABX1T3Y4_9PROT|nr:MotA/TolQ/ExbB proton channel family protein [Candidatus Accumulibacter contiguus]MBL8409259.1 MotA/TolQ/ExbB proton channel family protein [Accumulibacter sp.]NMQ03808.1 MotA/TolQ/ExbB proton channel family protein [Candidatus Accumulibacter contiguus]
MENPLGFAHFLAHTDIVARIVLCLMLIASIGTWYLIASKGIRGLRMRRRSAEFLAAFWKAPNLEAVAARIREKGTTEPFSHLVHHGFTAIEQHNRCKNGGECSTANLVNAGNPEDLLTRALKRAIDEDKASLEFGQTFLATVASSAPFVGLFGTVWGIYHALIAIGMSGQGTLDKVAGPVGEALIMTGIGLAVAIPAAVAYNHFARENRSTLSQLNSFAYDVFAFLATGVKTSPMLTDARTTSEKVIAMARAQGVAAGAERQSAHPGLAVR